MRLLIPYTLAVALGVTSPALFAQDSARAYPSKPIRIVVTFPPGGPTDIVARAVGQKLAESWGQPVMVDNRSGAGGDIGMDLVAKATADGHTLVLSSFGPLVISPFFYRNDRRHAGAVRRVHRCRAQAMGAGHQGGRGESRITRSTHRGIPTCSIS